jgi:uncharacterized protein (TIGR03066 family)
MTRSRFVIASVLFLGLALVGTAGTDNAKKIVGVWELVKGEGPPPGSVVTFTKDGKLKLEAKKDDKDVVITGTYKVTDDKIELKLKVKDETKEISHKIAKLTDKELVIDHEGKGTIEFKRVK